MNYFVVAALFLAVVYLANKYFLSYWSRNGFAQLKPKPLFGDIEKIFKMKTSMGELFEEFYNNHKKHPALGVYFSYRPSLLINDPMLIQDILVKDFTYFHDRPFHVDEENDPLSAHLLGLSGQKWRDLRVKLTPVFTSAKLKGMFSTIKDCGQVLEDYLVKNVKEGNNVFEFRDLMARYTTNIISSVAFGIENDCINDPDHIFRKMGAKIFEPSRSQAINGILGVFLPGVLEFLKKHVPSAQSFFKGTHKDVEEFIFSVVKQTIEYREKNNISRNDFMQLMIQFKNQGYMTVDKESIDGKAAEKVEVTKLTVNQIAAQVFIFFIAGFETSSSTMFFSLYEIAKNPEIQAKIQQEIDEAFKSAGPEGVTYETFTSMKYLECVIDETLRKYPIAPTLMRECTKDYKIAGTNKVIPKGTSIFLPVLGLQRDPEIYENPMEFNPDRFKNSSNGGSGKVKGVFYLPFGEGPRNCIGMRMGKLTTKMGLALVLSKFNFEFTDKSMYDRELEFLASQFILTPAKEFKFKISPR